MKKIIIRKSLLAPDRSLGVDYYNYYITYPNQPNYSYTVTSSEENMLCRMIPVFKEAGYEVDFI